MNNKLPDMPVSTEQYMHLKAIKRKLDGQQVVDLLTYRAVKKEIKKYEKAFFQREG